MFGNQALASLLRASYKVLWRSLPLPGSPGSSLCSVVHISRGRQRGHLWVPEPMLSGPKQGKEAEAKGKWVAGTIARGQKGPWRRAAGKHSATQEGWFCAENPGSKLRKALHSPKGSLESHTREQSSCTSTRTVFDWHVLTKFIREFTDFDNTHPRVPLSFFYCFPSPIPAKFLIKFSWI